VTHPPDGPFTMERPGTIATPLDKFMAVK